jgi:hypothetical protein
MLFRSPNPGTAEMLDTARWLEQELQQSEKAPQAGHSRDKKRAARRPGPAPSPSRDKNSPAAPDEPNPGVASETEAACWLPPLSPGQHEWDMDDSELRDIPQELKDLMEHFQKWYPRLRDPNWEPRAGENPRWADMEVQWLDGNRQPRNCWRPRYRACREGTQVRFVHRILTDRKPFARQKRAPVGTILIDASGSMSLSAADVVRILDHAPGATVAMYCGSGTLGVVRVLAYDGKVAERRSFENDIGKGNLIDGEALRFLADSPEPRYWVSDALVTGLGETTHDDLRRDAREVCQAGRITRFPDVENMVEFLKKPNARSVTRFFGQDAVVVKSESPSF